MFWLINCAQAASLAGMNVPWVGGGFAGPSEPGALGVIFTPSTAALAPAPEVALDVGLVAVSVDFQVDALGQVAGTLPQVQPTLMAAAPIGERFGVGAAVFAPYVRSGESDPEGPFRLFSISSTLMFLEADVIAAVRPVKWLSIGGSLRLGQFTLASTNAIDTGAMLNAALEPETPLPTGDALLEGHQTVRDVGEVTASWGVGVSLVHPKGPELHLAYRPKWTTGGEGTVELVPSDDLVARIEGDVSVALTLPPSFSLSGRLPMGRFTAVPELEWVGWSATGRPVYDVRNLVLTTSDPLLNGILNDVGLTESALIDSQEGVRDSDMEWSDVVNFGMYGSWRFSDALAARAGVWRGGSAVADRAVSPGNLDFASWEIRAGADWRPIPKLRTAFSLAAVPPSVRTITNSKYDLTNPATPEDALPSGNGRYSLTAFRAGVTLIYSFAPPDSVGAGPRGGAGAPPPGSPL